MGSGANPSKGPEKVPKGESKLKHEATPGREHFLHAYFPCSHRDVPAGRASSTAAWLLWGTISSRREATSPHRKTRPTRSNISSPRQRKQLPPESQPTAPASNLQPLGRSPLSSTATATPQPMKSARYLTQSRKMSPRNRLSTGISPHEPCRPAPITSGAGLSALLRESGRDPQAQARMKAVQLASQRASQWNRHSEAQITRLPLPHTSGKRAIPSSSSSSGQRDSKPHTAPSLAV